MELFRPNLPETLPATPFYFYDEEIIRTLAEGFRAAISANPKIVLHYAMKANSNLRVLGILKEFGAGLDIVSGEELVVGLKAGYTADQIVYSGVGKTEAELTAAITAEIGFLIVESHEEFEELCSLAEKFPNKKVRVGFRFNPNLNIDTHPYIATGLWEHKFGMAWEEIVNMMDRKHPANVTIESLSLHLGSQIFDDKVFYDALEEVAKLAQELRKKFKASFPILDVGGGLGVDYRHPFKLPDFEKYGKFLRAALHRWEKENPGVECKVYSECGRALVAQAGFLVTRVIRLKKNPKKHFAIVDASMTELIRPALYHAFHAIEKLSLAGETLKDKQVYDVVGPVCESGDFLGEKMELPKLQKGDLLWITCAGAYGYVMASNYNMRPHPAEYWLSNGELASLHPAIKNLELLI